MQGRGKSMGKCEGGQRVLRALREGLGDAPLGLSSALSCFLLCAAPPEHLARTEQLVRAFSHLPLSKAGKKPALGHTRDESKLMRAQSHESRGLEQGQ